MRVLKSTGGVNDKIAKREEKDKMLKDSWDYWERQGLPHPMKRTEDLVKPLQPIPKENRYE